MFLRHHMNLENQFALFKAKSPDLTPIIQKWYNCYTSLITQYMTTQVVFRVDPKLKSKAAKRAADNGMNLSAVLKLATQAFVDGEFQVGLKFNTKTRKDLNRILKDANQGKNLSPGFKSAKEMIADLKK